MAQTLGDLTKGGFCYLKVLNVPQHLCTEPTLGTQHGLCGNYIVTGKVPYLGAESILPSESLFYREHLFNRNSLQRWLNGYIPEVGLG